MLDISPPLIAKSLIEERDAYFELLRIKNKNLPLTVLTSSINIFATSYLLTINDESDDIDWNNTKSIYKKYYASRFNALRYLLETYLTTLKLLSIHPKDKNAFVYSLVLSEKILTHKNDKVVYTYENTNPKFALTLKKNDIEYKQFIKKYGKLHFLVPDCLEDYFAQGQLNPLKNKHFKSRFGFEPEPSGKINYKNTITEGDSKSLLLDHFYILKREQIFSEIMQSSVLMHMYSMLSKEAHPTLTSIETFENYLASEDKYALIKKKIHQNEIFLKIIGALMDVLCKTGRGATVFNLKDSYTN